MGWAGFSRVRYAEHTMSTAKNIVESFREVVQDLLVPELKSVRVSVDALRTEMRLMQDASREELKITKDALREEMKLRNESLERTIREGEQRTQQLVHSLSEKLDYAIDIRERLAMLEARLPRQ